MFLFVIGELAKRNNVIDGRQSLVPSYLT